LDFIHRHKGKGPGYVFSGAGVAEKIKENMGAAVNLDIFTNDSMEAMNYKLRSATTVFVNGEQLPLETALSVEKLEAYLKGLSSRNCGNAIHEIFRSQSRRFSIIRNSPKKSQADPRGQFRGSVCDLEGGNDILRRLCQVSRPYGYKVEQDTCRKTRITPNRMALLVRRQIFH
jgi:hypothetical protein